MFSERRRLGFTLIEFALTMVVAGVLLTIAIPSFTYVIESGRVRTVTNDFINPIHLARLEAIKSNTRVQYCGNDANSNFNDELGRECGINQPGAVVALLVDASGSSKAEKIREAPEVIGSSIHIAKVQALQFTPRSFGVGPSSNNPYSGEILVFCSDKLAGNNLVTVKMSVGIDTKLIKDSGACP